MTTNNSSVLELTSITFEEGLSIYHGPVATGVDTNNFEYVDLSFEEVVDLIPDSNTFTLNYECDEYTVTAERLSTSEYKLTATDGSVFIVELSGTNDVEIYPL